MLSICVLGLVSAQHASAAGWPYAQSSAALGFPSDSLANGGSWSLYSTACEATNSCVTVGYYEDTASNTQAYVVPITNGTPGTAVKVTLPANAATSSQDAYLTGVTCQGSACEAYGSYTDSSSTQEPMVVQITNGVPAIAQTVTAPADSVSSADVGFDGISCSSSTQCEAVGSYTSSTTGQNEPLVVAINGGVPQTAIALALPSNHGTGSNDVGYLDSVACQSSGDCAAVGYYEDSSGSDLALVVGISGGVPGAATETSVPNGAAAEPNAYLDYVACPQTGACEAIGYYQDTSSLTQDLVVPITAGAPGTPSAVQPLSNAISSSPAADLYGISCSSSSLCVASGYYEDSSTNTQAAVVTITGSGATAHEVTLPADAWSGGQDAAFYAYSNPVSCVPGGACLSGGYYETASNDYSGLVEQVAADGTVGPGITAAAPADQSSVGISGTGPYTYLYFGTGCDLAGSCVATGDYYNNASQFAAYEVSEQAPLAVTTTSLPAGSQHTAYSTPLGATGAWGVYSWSVSSGTLPAGLSLDAQTGVISGTPTAAGTFSFTVQATGTGGSPAPTATQSLSVTIAAVPPVIRILGHSGLVKGDRLGVKLGCSKWNCTGSVKIKTTEVVTVKHGKKHVRKHRTVVIGTAHYSLTLGKTEILKVKINSAGQKALAKAKNHRLWVTIAATVQGGNGASRHEKIWTAAKKHK